MAKEAAKTTAKEPAFSKEQFLNSSRFEPAQKDVLGAILEPNKLYTMAEAKKLLGDFLKRRVK